VKILAPSRTVSRRPAGVGDLLVRVHWQDEYGTHTATTTMGERDALHTWLLGHRRYVTDWWSDAPRLGADLKGEAKLSAFRRPRRPANESTMPLPDHRLPPWGAA